MATKNSKPLVGPVDTEIAADHEFPIAKMLLTARPPPIRKGQRRGDGNESLLQFTCKWNAEGSLIRSPRRLSSPPSAGLP